MSVSVAVTLDTRRLKKKTGKYPVKLLVTYDRDPQRYQTIYDLTESEFDGLFTAPRISEKLQRVRESLKQIKRRAEDTAEALKPFSFKEFEKDYILNNPLFRQRKKIKEVLILPAHDNFDCSPYLKKYPVLTGTVPEPGTIGYNYLQSIKNLLRAGRIGTATNYNSSYHSLKEFGGNVKFTHITVDYLRAYEQWMKEKGRSKSTIGMYLRALRTMFNDADAAGIIRKDKCYPFGRRKYLIPKAKNPKKALFIDELSKIYYYEPTCESEWRARDYWLFLYFGNGMNTKDFALLKFKNIDGEYLTFERAKTEWSTRNDPKPITVFLSEDMLNIIDHWGNKDKTPDNYIFPVLENGLSPLQLYKQIQLLIEFINDWMEKIRLNVGIKKKVRTMNARHTFSTVMKRSGASTEFIQEALGHTDVKTTENYLDSFEKEVKKEFAGKLIMFKKENANKQVSNFCTPITAMTYAVRLGSVSNRLEL